MRQLIPSQPDDENIQARPWLDWFTQLIQLVSRDVLYTPSINPTSVPANSEDSQTFTVTGLVSGNHVTVNKPTKTTDLSILDAFISADDTLSITFRNFSGSPINPGTETYLVVEHRR